MLQRTWRRFEIVGSSEWENVHKQNILGFIDDTEDLLESGDYRFVETHICTII